MKWKCPICGKKFEYFGIKEFVSAPKTTLFSKISTTDMNGSTELVRKINKPVCSNECKQNNEKQYFVEKYKGNNIYCVDGRYMPYLDCEYWYDNIDGVKNRIDHPNLIPVTPILLNGLIAVASGVPDNI